MGKFDLINPILAGNINTTFEATTPIEAAQKFWDMLTNEKQLVVNELHHFMFTLRGSNNELHHFSIRETKENDEVSYKLDDVTKEVEKNADPNMMKEFTEEVSNVQARLNGEKKISTGGKKGSKKGSKKGNAKGGKRDRSKDMKKDDSSSSSDSDSDDDFDFDRLRRRMYTRPISYWWYSPMIYRVRRIYTPVFAKPLAPYVQLWLPMR